MSHRALSLAMLAVCTVAPSMRQTSTTSRSRSRRRDKLLRVPGSRAACGTRAGRCGCRWAKPPVVRPSSCDSTRGEPSVSIQHAARPRSSTSIDSARNRASTWPWPATCSAPPRRVPCARRPPSGLKKIAGYSCRGVRISGPGSAASLDLFLTTELPIGIETFADFLEWSGASSSLGAVMDEAAGSGGVLH